MSEHGEWTDARELRSSIEGLCAGVIYCSVYLGATSAQIGHIRAPATIILTLCLLSRIVAWLAKR